MELLPEDAEICVSVDLDEVFQPGWRRALEAAWRPGTKQAAYRYTWNFRPDGSEGCVFFREQIHTRRGFRWKNPVHEVLEYIGEEPYACVRVPGMQLDRCAELAQKVDTAIGEKYQMAFDNRLGYLTAFPTDVGTGMRASVLLHLPALTAQRQTGPVMQTVSKLGLTLRGFYGEGSEARGNMYVLTNQASLGRSEDDILRSVTAAAEQIVAHERQTREKAEKADMLALQDRLLRSYGEVMHARIMTAKEMARRLSDIRYAASMGYVHAPIGALDELLMDLQPGSLKRSAGRELSDREIDALRAERLRRRLEEIGRMD